MRTKDKKSQKEKLAALEQENQLLRERAHNAQTHIARIITFNPLSLPPNRPGGKLGLVRAVDKQKSIAIKALLVLEPDPVKAQKLVERYGTADGEEIPDGKSSSQEAA